MMEEQEGESDNENHGVGSIISPDEMLKIGLRLAGYKQHRMNRAKNKETNIERFKAQLYGLSPAFVAAIWDIQLTEAVSSATSSTGKLVWVHFFPDRPDLGMVLNIFSLSRVLTIMVLVCETMVGWVVQYCTY
jgi:hypothetical protein